MDSEKLIEQLKGISNGLAEDEFPKCANAVRQAATAFSTLQAENERLRAELEQIKRERDAAVESWRGFCAKCAWNGKQYLSDGKMDDRCKTCRDNNKCNWEWRGPKEDDHEVS